MPDTKTQQMPERLEIVKGSWEGDEYRVLVGDARVLAQEPTAVSAYPEGVFVRGEGRPGDLEEIARRWNAHKPLLDAVADIAALGLDARQCRDRALRAIREARGEE